MSRHEKMQMVGTPLKHMIFWPPECQKKSKKKVQQLARGPTKEKALSCPPGNPKLGIRKATLIAD